MDALVDSVLLFGRPSLGATIGLAIGWPTQGERHSRWVIGWVLAGYFVGVATMWDHWGPMLVCILLLIPATIGWLAGLAFGAATLGGREDSWIRIWGFVGFLLFYHLFAILGAWLTNLRD